MTGRPKPLDRQLAEERARHPTPAEAARSGARFGLLIAGARLVFDVADRLGPGDLGPHRAALPGGPQWAVAAAVTLVAGALAGVVVGELGAGLTRWRRRAAARVWYPDRAA